jgi:hypothetical protein
MVCQHDHVEYDPAGRPVCTTCGEVLEEATHYVSTEVGPKAVRGVLVPAAAPKEEIPSPTTFSLVESVCAQCERTAKIQISTDLKDRLMHLLVAFKLSTGLRPVYSYENLIRTGLLVVLRESGHAIQASKLIPRFDGKRAPLFRLLSKMNQLLGLRMESVNSDVLIQHCSEILLSELRRKNLYPLKILTGERKQDLLDDIVTIACRLLALMTEHGNFGPRPRLTHAVACTYFAVRYGCDHHPSLKKRDFTLLSSIEVLELAESEHTIYKQYEELKNFLMKGLQGIGYRVSDERQVIEHLTEIEGNQRARAQLSKRIRLISES